MIRIHTARRLKKFTHKRWSVFYLHLEAFSQGWVQFHVELGIEVINSNSTGIGIGIETIFNHKIAIGIE